MSLSATALSSSTNIPGFPPVDSFLQFLVTTSIIQGSLFASVASGADMANDIEGGFFERLIASPVARTSILVGRVGGAAVLGFFQSLLFLGIVAAVGTPIDGGVVAVLMIASTVAVFAAGIGAVSVSFALRTGSSEAVQGSFPLLFSLLFLSSGFFPRDLMHGWFHSVATINPMSHMIEGLRHQIIFGIDVGKWGLSFGIASAVFVLGVGLALVALRARLRKGGA